MDREPTISQRLFHLSFVLGRQSDQVLLERFGIGFSQFKIMMVLMRHHGIQQSKIAETLGQTEASVSRQIKLLMDKGLLVSTVDPNNRRRHITALSASGARLADEAVRALDVFHAPVIEILSEKQQQQLIEILDTMHRQACASGRLTVCSHSQ